LTSNEFALLKQIIMIFIILIARLVLEFHEMSLQKYNYFIHKHTIFEIRIDFEINNYN